MTLLDDLRSILTHHKQHVTSQTNQGGAHLIERHLKQLDDVAGDAEAGTAEAHKVLGELYGALNAPAVAEEPAPAPKAAKSAKAAPAEKPAG